jgi:hypothetical protein
VAQNAGEPFASDRVVGVLAVSLQEGHPPLCLGGEQFETLARLVQHRRGRVEDRDVITSLGERERLVAGAASHIEHSGGRRRQMLQQVLVQHVGAHVSLHRGIRLIDEEVRQAGACPRAIAHAHKISVSN